MKSESNPHILKDDFRKLQTRFKDYTDGSKESSKVGCAVITDNHCNMQHDGSSIFTAEANVADLALDLVRTCSDALSVLRAIDHTSSKNPHIQKLLEKMSRALSK